MYYELYVSADVLQIVCLSRCITSCLSSETALDREHRKYWLVPGRPRALKNFGMIPGVWRHPLASWLLSFRRYVSCFLGIFRGVDATKLPPWLLKRDSSFLFAIFKVRGLRFQLRSPGLVRTGFKTLLVTKFNRF